MERPNYKVAKDRSNENISLVNYNDFNNYYNLLKGKTYYLRTYGCQMNEHDSENIKAMLEDLGLKESSTMQGADVVLLNTCSIRENAHNKAFGMLGRLKHLKEEKNNLVIGICGCMSQEEGVVESIISKYKYVNFVIGTNNMYKLPEVLVKSINSKKQVIEVTSEDNIIAEGIPVIRASKYKAFVNIIYGCDKFCTYCIVPYTRGRQRSRKKDSILKEVLDLKESGYQEVMLLGQNVNAYGKDLDDNYYMDKLLKDVAEIGIPRVRFMTSHPWDFTDSMIEVIKKYPNIMKCVHLPVQSGSSKILKLMGRRYTKEDYIKLFDKLRSIPNMTISTDIIVGFPGETEEDFQETIDLCNYCKFDNAYTFIFSERENTPACKLNNKVEETVKEERLQRLNEVVNNYFLESNKKLVGKVLPVLVEDVNKDGLFGYLENMKLVNFDGDKSLIGKIVNVEIIEAKTWSLDGRYIK